MRRANSATIYDFLTETKAKKLWIFTFNESMCCLACEFMFGSEINILKLGWNAVVQEGSGSAASDSSPSSMHLQSYGNLCQMRGQHLHKLMDIMKRKRRVSIIPASPFQILDRKQTRESLIPNRKRLLCAVSLVTVIASANIGLNPDETTD